MALKAYIHTSSIDDILVPVVGFEYNRFITKLWVALCAIGAMGHQSHYPAKPDVSSDTFPWKFAER